MGRPWGKTALLTGYSGRDLLFGPAVYEYYQTITYAGLQRQFGSHIRVTGGGGVSARLAGRRQSSMRLRKLFVRALGWTPRSIAHWRLSASGAWSSGRGFHAYDNVTSSFMLSYTRERGLGQEAGFGDSVGRLSHAIFFRPGTAKLLRFSGAGAHPGRSGGAVHILTMRFRWANCMRARVAMTTPPESTSDDKPGDVESCAGAWCEAVPSCC